MLLVPHAAARSFVAVMLNQAPAEDFILKLYINEHAPVLGDSVDDYVEAAGFGYAPIPLSATAWTIDSVGHAVHGLVKFTFTGKLGAVYGYYVVGASSGLLKWAEAFEDGPFEVKQAEAQIKIVPKFS